MPYLNVLKQLRSTKSRNQKLEILSRNADRVFKKILYYTYHPLLHYHLRKLPWTGNGTCTLVEAYQNWIDILDSLNSGLLSGQRAKDVVSVYIQSLTYEDGELFKKILKKDIRAGIGVTSINAVWPGFIPVFGAMLAKPFHGPFTGPMMMSLKLDGLRAIKKEGTLYTRNGHKIIGVEHVLEAAKDFDTLDGELMIPGLNFQTASGLIRSHNQCPKAVFHVFDIPEADQPFVKRYNELQDRMKALHDIPSIKLVKHVAVYDQKKIDITFNKAINAGYEGLVLKTFNHKYQTKRSKDWLKIKAVRSEDLPIVDFYEGEGRLEDSLGGIVVKRSNGVTVKVGTGFSDDHRHEIWANQKHFLGLTAEVLYHEVTPDGSLRHTRLKTIRADK